MYMCVCVKLEIVTKVDEFLLSLEFLSNCFSNIVMQPLHSTLWIFSTTTKKNEREMPWELLSKEFLLPDICRNTCKGTLHTHPHARTKACQLCVSNNSGYSVTARIWFNHLHKPPKNVLCCVERDISFTIFYKELASHWKNPKFAQQRLTMHSEHNGFGGNWNAFDGERG